VGAETVSRFIVSAEEGFAADRYQRVNLREDAMRLRLRAKGQRISRRPVYRFQFGPDGKLVQ
jgi:hypothetical protein